MFFNALFFSIIAYILPIHFETNDDVFMSLIASGVYSGSPDAHLVFINYIYGFVLTIFYNTFSGIEWYTIFFCIIHVVSLSIIVFQFIQIKKPALIKSVFIILLYAIELRIILLFQFTTTAAIGAFAGVLLLLDTGKVYKICGVFLFLVAVLVRFDAAMLVLLLMLPIFGFEVFSNKKKVIEISISVATCIFGALILHIINNQIYNRSHEWSEYKEYNAIRGRINGTLNAEKIINELPDGIYKNDYQLLLNFFTDGQIINLSKIKELDDLIQKTPLTEKLKNIYPSVRRYTTLLGLIGVLFAFCFFAENRNKIKIYNIFYLMFFLGVLSYIPIGGFLRDRVFISALFPVIFFLYKNTPSFYDKKIRMEYLGVVFILSLHFFGYTYLIRKDRNENEKTVVKEQRTVLKEVQNKTVSVLPIASELTYELFCSPFDISKTFDAYSMIITPWFTNIPFNKDRFDSYMSLVDTNLYIFISEKYLEKYAVAIQKALIEHYGCDTEIIKKFGNENYWLIQFKKK